MLVPSHRLTETIPGNPKRLLINRILRDVSTSAKGAQFSFASPPELPYSCRQRFSPSAGLWDRPPAIPMHRVIAKLLLTVLLSGTLVPAALAFVSVDEHACCRRKQPHCHDSQELSFHSRSCGHDCCRSLAINQWAQPRPPVSSRGRAVAQGLAPSSFLFYRNAGASDSRSVRAPPQVTPSV
jgi:hypothetical protein